MDSDTSAARILKKEVEEMVRKIVWASAPVRIDLAGGWTDIPELCSESNPGHVLSLAIRPGTSAVVIDRGEGNSLSVNINGQGFYFSSLQELEMWDKRLVTETLLHAYRKGAPLFERSIMVLIHQGYPRSAGLGGSASMVVAVLCALQASMRVVKWRSHDTLERLAENAHDVHRSAGVLGGKQDEYISSFGGLCLMKFEGKRVSILHRETELLSQIGSRLVLAYVGKRSEASGDIIDRVLQEGSNSGLGDLLNPMRDIPQRMWEALQRSDYSGVGKLMSDNWSIQQKIPGVDDPRFHKVIELAEGKFEGVKACGAGGGGCLVFWSKNAEELKRILRENSVQVLEFEPSINGAECSIMDQS